MLTKFISGVLLAVVWLTYGPGSNAGTKVTCPPGPYGTKSDGVEIKIDSYPDFPSDHVRSGATIELIWRFDITDAEHSFVTCMYATQTNGVPDTVRVFLPVGTTSCKMTLRDTGIPNTTPEKQAFWCE